MTNYARRTARGTIIVFIFSLFAALFAYLFRILLAKRLTLEEFGFFFALFAFSSIIFMIKDLGITQSAVYFIPKFLANNNRKKVKALISKILKINIINSAVVFILFSLFASFLIEKYFHAGTPFLVFLFALSFFINCMELPFQVFSNAFQNQFLFSIHNFSRNFLVFLLTFIGFLFFSGIAVPILAYIFMHFILLAIFPLLFFKKTFPDYFKIKNKIGFKLKDLLLFGIPVTMSSFGFLLISYADILILTYFRTLEEVGLYSAAVPIITLMLYFPFAICVVIFPLSSELWAKKKLDALRFAIEKISKLVFIVLIPIAGVLLIYPDLILTLLYGSNFVSAQSALFILTIGAIFYGIAQINMTFLIGIAGPKLNMYIWMCVAVVNLVLNFILIPRYSITGAATATVISYFVLFVLSVFFLYRKVSIKLNFMNYFLIFASGGIFLWIVNYLKNALSLGIWIESILVIIISLLIYGAFLFILKIITLKEIKEIIYQILKKKE